MKPLQRDVGSLRTKLFYGFGSVAFGVKDNGFQTILLLFYNQVMHLPPQLVGLALAIAMICDAVVDPVVGNFSDHLRTRWGRRHPLMYASALPVAISYLLLWNPPHWSQGALFIYLFVVAAIVVRTFITFYEIPSSALNPELTEDYDQRTALSSYRVFFAWIGGMTMYLLALGVFLTPDATHKVGQLNETGYSHYGIAGRGPDVLRHPHLGAGNAQIHPHPAQAAGAGAVDLAIRQADGGDAQQPRLLHPDAGADRVSAPPPASSSRWRSIWAPISGSSRTDRSRS